MSLCLGNSIRRGLPMPELRRRLGQILLYENDGAGVPVTDTTRMTTPDKADAV